MMRFTIRVQYVDGTEATAVASVPDFLAFERKYDRGVTDFQNGARLDWILFMAHHALTRSKQLTESYDAWVERVDGIDLGDREADPIVPLESTAPTGQ
jgi:hypothetical protein